MFKSKNTVVRHEFNYCMMPKVPNIYFKKAHTVKGSLTVEKVHLIDMGYEEEGDDYIQYEIYLYHAVNPNCTSTMNMGFQVQVSLPLYKEKKLQNLTYEIKNYETEKIPVGVIPESSPQLKKAIQDANQNKGKLMCHHLFDFPSVYLQKYFNDKIYDEHDYINFHVDL